MGKDTDILRSGKCTYLSEKLHIYVDIINGYYCHHSYYYYLGLLSLFTSPVFHFYICCDTWISLQFLSSHLIFRYIAVCEPLRYSSIMTSARLHSCCALAWLVAVLCIAVLFGLHADVPMCGNIIQHIYCSNRGILNLACTPTPINNVYGQCKFRRQTPEFYWNSGEIWDNSDEKTAVIVIVFFCLSFQVCPWPGLWAQASSWLLPFPT